MNLDVQKRLFRPFMQGEGETTRRFGGTGLGLVITQRLVEIMNGAIELESTEGAGSLFSVHITMDECSELPPKETSNLEGIKVALLTNDDVTQLLSSYLRHAGADVVWEPASNALDAWETNSTASDADVVVIDSRNDRKSSITLRDALRDHKNNIDRRFLLIDRGNRRFARPYEGDGMTLDLNAMRRDTLLNAIATLAGRESPVQHEPKELEGVPKTPLSIDEAKKQGRLILLVDDNPTNIKVICQQLNMLGYLVETAEDGAVALDMWRDGDYSLILTDCHMPVMDGYQLSESVRIEEPLGSRIPIIAITADALKGTAQKCVDAGMNDYLTKPMKLQQLSEVLEKWTSQDITENKTNLNTKLTSDDIASKADIDPSALGKILGTQDPVLLTEYYINFLETSTPTVQRLHDAYNQDDFAEVSRLAHKLKSSSRTVGAVKLGDCCHALERAAKASDTKSADSQIALLSGLFKDVENWIEKNHETA
jgi:CheY-like chemotaxis protein